MLCQSGARPKLLGGDYFLVFPANSVTGLMTCCFINNIDRDVTLMGVFSLLFICVRQ